MYWYASWLAMYGGRGILSCLRSCAGVSVSCRWLLLTATCEQVQATSPAGHILPASSGRPDLGCNAGLGVRGTELLMCVIWHPKCA